MLALANTFYYPSVSSTPAVRPIMTTAGSSSYGEGVCFFVIYKLDPYEWHTSALKVYSWCIFVYELGVCLFITSVHPEAPTTANDMLTTTATTTAITTNAESSPWGMFQWWSYIHKSSRSSRNVSFNDHWKGCYNQFYFYMVRLPHTGITFTVELCCSKHCLSHALHWIKHSIHGLNSALPHPLFYAMHSWQWFNICNSKTPHTSIFEL